MNYTLEQLKKMMDDDGSLDLEGGTSITALHEGLTVGGSLDLSGTSIENADTSCVKKLHNGDYVPGRYLYADGILTHVKRKKTIMGGSYTEMTTDSTVTYEEAIVMYRIITGACRQGTQSFLDTLSEAIKRKKSYTVGEIIELTKGQYGAESFRRFFEGRE